MCKVTFWVRALTQPLCDHGFGHFKILLHPAQRSVSLKLPQKIPPCFLVLIPPPLYFIFSLERLECQSHPCWLTRKSHRLLSYLVFPTSLVLCDYLSLIVLYWELKQSSTKKGEQLENVPQEHPSKLWWPMKGSVLSQKNPKLYQLYS